jgi:predicted naringenin-chalcone synthase
MFSTKQLSEEQIATIKSWAAAGAQLPEIQLRMKEELGLSVTYMDTRFVVLDLGIELIEEKKEDPAQEIKQAPVATGKVTLTMDSVAIPGAIVSGKAIFSDGESAIWMLDQTGRPALDPDTAGYQPSQADILEFQKQLRALIESTGL